MCLIFSPRRNVNSNKFFVGDKIMKKRLKVKMICTTMSIILPIVMAISPVFGEKKAYLFSGEGNYVVMDTAEDKILKTGSIRGEAPFLYKEGRSFIYDVLAFQNGRAIIVTTEYKIYVLDAETLKLIKGLDINSQYEHMNFLVSPDGRNIFIVWLPYKYISEHVRDGKRNVTLLDENFIYKTIEGLELPDTIRAINFSTDGNKLYLVYFPNKSGEAERIQIIDVANKILIREISFDEVGAKNTYKTVEGLQNKNMLIVEPKQDGPQFRDSIYVYDIEKNGISNPIDTNKEIDCKLYSNGLKVVCEEERYDRGNVTKLGYLYFYDVNQAKEIGFIALTATEGAGKIIGITPDNKKLYYQTKNGLKVIDLETLTIIKTEDVSSGLVYMTFYGY